jgi:hypothetical protein
MAINYKKVSYLSTRPDVAKIFQDLEMYYEFCRFEMLPYNEADLYNRTSRTWNQFYNRVYKKTLKGYKARED